MDPNANVETKIHSAVNKQIIKEIPAVFPNLIPIGSGKYVKVCSYRNKPYINIRDYTTTAEGRLNSTRRGILLSPEEWKQLKKCTKEVDLKVKTL